MTFTATSFIVKNHVNHKISNVLSKTNLVCNYKATAKVGFKYEIVASDPKSEEIINEIVHSDFRKIKYQDFVKKFI